MKVDRESNLLRHILMSVVRWQPVVVVSTIMVAQRRKSGEEVSQATKSGEVGLNKILEPVVHVQCDTKSQR